MLTVRPTILQSLLFCAIHNNTDEKKSEASMGQANGQVIVVKLWKLAIIVLLLGGCQSLPQASGYWQPGQIAPFQVVVID